MKPDNNPRPDGPSVAASLDNIRRQWGPAVEEGAPESASIKSSAFLPDGAAAKNTPPEAVSAPRRSVATGEEDGGPEDFVLGELLGKGGMGLVFRAEQAGLDRDVALKTIIPDRAVDGEARRKFFAEAQVTGQLDHPNIVPIYELATAPDGALFYTMKEVRGRAWSKAMPTLSEAENIDILLKVADAVAFAHGKGVIHRDLKPENVMLGDYGEVLLMDWGLAVGVTDEAKAERLSPANARGGTPAYMAPEMAAADAEKIGPASDVYLLGAILYEILTGLRPHHGQNVFACIFSALRNAIQPSDRRDEWMDVARRALSTDPAKRFRDVKEFQQAARACREHAASLALSKEARETLTRAKQSGDYTDYARAVFGFGEALRMWPENNAADLGLTLARKTYAEAALTRGDFDLVLSQSSKISADGGGELTRQAEAGKAERERRRIRSKRLACLTIGLTAAVVLGGGAAYWHTARSERVASAALAAKNAAEARRDALSEQLRRLTAEFELNESAKVAEPTLPASPMAAALTGVSTMYGDAQRKMAVLAGLAQQVERPEDRIALADAFLGLSEAARQRGDEPVARQAERFAQVLRGALPETPPVDGGENAEWAIYLADDPSRPLPCKPPPADDAAWQTVRLSALDLKPALSGWKRPRRLTEETPVNVGGRTFTDGLWAHAYFNMDMAVNDAVAFSGWVGVPENAMERQDCFPLLFRLYGDGRLLWESENLTAATPPQRFDVDLAGVRLMTLIIRAPPGASGVNAHGALLDPVFAVRGERPPAHIIYDPVLTPRAYYAMGLEMGFDQASDASVAESVGIGGHAFAMWEKAQAYTDAPAFHWPIPAARPSASPVPAEESESAALPVSTAQPEVANSPREVPYIPGQPMPDGAGPGEAWCLYQYPAVTETIYEEVRVRDAITVVKPIPPEFGAETMLYECEPAYQVGTVVAPQLGPADVQVQAAPAHRAGATLRAKTIDVEVIPAYTEEIWASAIFQTENTAFEISPARDELQQVACVDGTNMDCYVTVRVPAKMQTVEVKTLVQPGHVMQRVVPAKTMPMTVQELVADGPANAVAIPAVFVTVPGQAVTARGRVQIVDIPAKRCAITVMKVTREAGAAEVMLPAISQRVARTMVKEPARMVWRLQRIGIALPAQQVGGSAAYDPNRCEVCDREEENAALRKVYAQVPEPNPAIAPVPAADSDKVEVPDQ